MGVSGDVLQRVLRTAGRDLDLTKYKFGILTEQSEEPSSKRRRLRPLRIGLDVSNWIARAAHGNGAMLVDDRYLTNYGRSRLEKGEETKIDLLTSEENRRKYIEACTQRVLSQIQNLQCMSQANVIVVLDGASPPIKRDEVKRRREKTRQAALERDSRDQENKAKTLERRIKAGKAAGAGACYGIIVRELIQALREENITFIVAPYEADGQLANLCHVGAIDMVITEDSDLLCQKIPNLLFKYNWDGEGILIQRNDLGSIAKKSRTLCLMDFSTSMLAIMFVCIGCDYCDSLKGIGSVTAQSIVSKVFLETKIMSKPALRLVFDLLYDYSGSRLSAEEKKDYESRFLGALFMYQHPVIFCPKHCRYMFANDPPRGSDPILLEYEPYAILCRDVEKQHELLGSFPEKDLQVAIAEGWVNPFTLQPYPDVTPPPLVQKLFEQTIDKDCCRMEASEALTTNGIVIRACDKSEYEESVSKSRCEQEAAEDTQESRSDSNCLGDPETQCFDSPLQKTKNACDQELPSTQQMNTTTLTPSQRSYTHNFRQNTEERADGRGLNDDKEENSEIVQTDDDVTVKFDCAQSPFQSFLSPVQDTSHNEGRMLNTQMSCDSSSNTFFQDANNTSLRQDDSSKLNSSGSVQFSSSPSAVLTQETNSKSPHHSSQSSRTTLNQDSCSKMLSTQSSGNSSSRFTSQSSSGLSPALLP